MNKLTSQSRIKVELAHEADGPIEKIHANINGPNLIEAAAYVQINHATSTIHLGRFAYALDEPSQSDDLVALAHGKLIDAILKSKPEVANYSIRPSYQFEYAHALHAYAFEQNPRGFFAPNINFSDYNKKILTALNRRGFKFNVKEEKQTPIELQVDVGTKALPSDIYLSHNLVNDSDKQSARMHIIKFSDGNQTTGSASMAVIPTRKEIHIFTFFPHEHNTSPRRAGVGAQAQHKMLLKLVELHPEIKDHKILVMPPVSPAFRALLRAGKLGRAVYSPKASVEKQGINVVDWLTKSRYLMNSKK